MDLEYSHTLVVYDSRNPAFSNNGSGHKAYQDVRAALGVPSLLRRCSWQKIVTQLRHDPALDWLTAALGKKYGLS